MIPRRRSNCCRWACLLTALFVPTITFAADRSASFREILELAETGTQVLAQLSEGREYNDTDWQTLLQVFNRLDQFRDLQPAAPAAPSFPEVWLAQPESQIGEVFEIEGWIDAIETIVLPEKWAPQLSQPSIFRCRFRFLVNSESNPAVTTILTTRIPQRWLSRENLEEHVRLRGALVKLSEHGGVWQSLLLTNHVAWFPLANAPTGQLLLARYGMDVALLDEVVHEQPFVKPEISREGEAFYAALTALEAMDQGELANLTHENVNRAAMSWSELQPKLRREHQSLQQQLTAAADEATRNDLQLKIKQAKNRRGLAASVVKQAKAGLSSVAPLFLQPEQEVGELYTIEGTARRAIRIVAEPPGEVDAYFELEIFTADSQNLPIVCCVHQLPAGFPIGDQIREPVQISAVFFKKWRYRSRKLVGGAEEASRQRQLYAPVLLGKEPIWLRQSVGGESSGAFWGGLAFLAVLVMLWVYLAWLARRDRLARIVARPRTTIDL